MFTRYTEDKFNQLEERLMNEGFSKDILMIVNKGEVPVLFTASHSVSQNRDGRIKLGECVTGAIVEGLHRDLNCYSCYKTYNCGDDANWDKNNYFKDRCIRLVKEKGIDLSVDIHCMSDKREYDVDIGTGEGNNLLNEKVAKEIKDIFNKNGIEDVRIDYMFKAINPNTVSSTIHRETGVDAIQLEINYALLDSNNDRYKFSNVIDSLKEIAIVFGGDYE